MNGYSVTRALRRLSARRTLLLIATLAILPFTASAQVAWTATALADRSALQLEKAPNGDIYTLTHTGILRSTDAGATWSEVMIDVEATPWDIEVTPDGTLVVLFLMQVARSTDQGETWQSAPVQALYKHLSLAADGSLVASATQGLYRSTDNGATWKKLAGTGLPGGVPDVSALAIGNSGEMYAATGGIVGGHLFTANSIDGEWAQIYEGEVNHDITEIGVAPNGMLYLGMYNKSIMRSTDGGDTWAETGPDMSEDAATAFAFLHGNVFAGWGEGVLLSTDNGLTWTAASSGLPEETIVNGFLQVGENRLLVATTKGIYAYEAAAGVEDAIAGVADVAVLPNPAFGRAVVRFDLFAPTHVGISLLDSRGEHCGTIASERFEAGEGEVVWDAEGVPAGLYFIRIETGDRVITRPVVITH